MKDRVFFYGPRATRREAKWDRVNKVGTPLPDEVRTGPEFYGKLTAVADRRHISSPSAFGIGPTTSRTPR